MQPFALALLFGTLGVEELLLILLVVLLLFGGRKIPELARGLGRGVAEFRNAMRGGAAEKPPEKPLDTPASGERSDTAPPSPKDPPPQG